MRSAPSRLVPSRFPVRNKYALQICLGEVCPAEVCQSKSCTLQVHAAEVGIAKVRVDEWIRRLPFTPSRNTLHQLRYMLRVGHEQYDISVRSGR